MKFKITKDLGALRHRALSIHVCALLFLAPMKGLLKRHAVRSYTLLAKEELTVSKAFVSVGLLTVPHAL